MITGHETDPLIPGEDLLALPGFWAAYLMWLAEGEDFEPEPELFGVDGADADAAYTRLSDPAAWPILRLPMQHGHSILIVHRNFTEDSGIDYYVVHPDWDQPRSLASIEGHFAGPGLAWRELDHIARHPATDRGSPTRTLGCSSCCPSSAMLTCRPTPPRPSPVPSLPSALRPRPRPPSPRPCSTTPSGAARPGTSKESTPRSAVAAPKATAAAFCSAQAPTAPASSASASHPTRTSASPKPSAQPADGSQTPPCQPQGLLSTYKELAPFALADGRPPPCDSRSQHSQHRDTDHKELISQFEMLAAHRAQSARSATEIPRIWR
ncbi:hypothetical protein [Kitasatospora aureofaciens]|uniref:hypothetical protein n=1 Tax=Kitasatospora aureofaciens TaxID=1894 RepID=UPI0033F89272